MPETKTIQLVPIKPLNIQGRHFPKGKIVATVEVPAVADERWLGAAIAKGVLVQAPARPESEGETEETTKRTSKGGKTQLEA